MKCTDIQKRLSDYHDGDLASREELSVEAHLKRCHSCQQELQQLQLLLSKIAKLPSAIEPQEDLWPHISSSIAKVAQEAHLSREREKSPRPRTESLIASALAGLRLKAKSVRWGLVAATAAAVLILVSFSVLTSSLQSSWKVQTIDGQPLISSARIDKATRLPVGEMLRTDEGSRARIHVGLIGEVVLEPNTVVQLIKSSWLDHRIALERGSIRANISAPPRLFFVETASAVAVDLGCVYDLQVDETGTGHLRVISGRVALESDGFESFVPAGAICSTKTNSGPGIPCFEDASDLFKESLARVQFNWEDSEALETLLTEARTFDTLTLWHLLFRVSESQRGKIFDGLARFAPVTGEVTREGVTDLDEQVLRTLRKRLAIYWLREDVPFWKKWWRDAWSD